MGFFPMPLLHGRDIRRPGGRIDFRTGMALFTRTFLLKPLSRIPLRSFALELFMASDSQDGPTIAASEFRATQASVANIVRCIHLDRVGHNAAAAKARSAASWLRTETKNSRV
ncbi:hypothetical protein [Bradyrhizobium erythrophlei]|jgi:hypothetical protein|uniref:hypothetical protein n=1 Tax=Bradyrhizobium erythrophlei TaxID=1437360 RepID=UPI0012AB3579|nr:hypothetical protein [Bradyrhizobium erythrophlei]